MLADVQIPKIEAVMKLINSASAITIEDGPLITSWEEEQTDLLNADIRDTVFRFSYDLSGEIFDFSFSCLALLDAEIKDRKLWLQDGISGELVILTLFKLENILCDQNNTTFMA